MMQVRTMALAGAGTVALLVGSANAAVITEDFESGYGSFSVDGGAGTESLVANPDVSFTEGGSQVVKLDGSTGGFARIFRNNNIALDPTMSYTLSLDVYNAQGGVLYIRLRDGSVSPDGNTNVTDAEFTATPISDLFTRYTAVIGPASDPNATFTFGAGTDYDFTLRIESGSGPNVNYVDNVSLTAVPEPASLALLGLGGLAIASRRRSL